MPANWFRVNSNGTLARIKELYRVNSNGTLARLKALYRLNSNGTLARVFGSDGPTIQDTVRISKSGDYHNSTYPVTLTGTKYHFDDADSFSYRFFSSPTGSDPWLPITPATTTSNPATGSFSTVTYQLVDADFTSSTMYFQFRYTGTDTTVSPNLSTTSASTPPLGVNYLAIPAPPPGFPNINQSTISISSTASTGTWTGSPTLYDWAWQYNNNGYKTLTFSQSRSVSSKYLSGFSAALVTSSSHGYKANDNVIISGMDSLFNGTHSIFLATSNTIYFTLPTPTAYSLTSTYTSGTFVSFNGDAYRAVSSLSASSAWTDAGTGYSVGNNVYYNSNRYIANSSLSSALQYSGGTMYSAGNIVYVGNNRYQSNLNNNIGNSFTNTTWWTNLGSFAPGVNSMWTTVMPSNSSYWTLQSFSDTPASGTATGSNYYEGTSSSAVSYTIPSFPSTDYKTGTSLLSKLTRMAVTVYNILYNASANSSARTIYAYPTIFLGTVSKTSTNASITYADVNVDTYDIDIKTQIFVSSAAVSGSNIVYTTDATHGLSTGTFVTVSGLSPSAFNRSNAEILSTTSNTFTVSNTTATGLSSGTGSISVSGQNYTNTIIGYPKTNQSNSSPILITGLIPGKTYNVFVTPKNADSPRISGVQKTTTFSTPLTPVNTVLPTITPLNNRSYVPIDTVLTCSPGSWTGVDANTVYTYDWQYFEGGAIGWISLGITTNTYTSTFVGDVIRCVVTATNDSQSTSATSISRTSDQKVAVGLVSPTSPTVNTSTNFTFNISHYPTSYVVDWGDGTSNSYTVLADTSTVNASISKTYTSTGNRTITVTAQPGNISRSTNIVVSQPAPVASGFARADVTPIPSDPSVIDFSSSNNQVTSTWTNGSPITSVVYSLSGAGTNASVTDTTFPFVSSDLTSYSQSGTYSFTVTNFNNNFVIRVSWNQANAQSYNIYYTGSNSGPSSVSGNSSASQVSADIPWSSANGSFTFTNLYVYSGTDQTGTVGTYSTGLTSISPNVKISTRTNTTSLTYIPPAPVNTSIPTLSPTSIFVGTTLTAGVGSWSNSPTSYDIRIYRGTAGVLTSETLVASGTSTSLTYTVTQADLNSGQLYFRTYVNASNAGGSSGFVAGQERGPIQVSAPVNTIAPSVTPSSGAAGTTFSTTNGSWSNSPTSYAYLWQYREGANWITTGQTGSTFNSISWGSFDIRCRVTATNAGGSTAAFSNSVTVTSAVSVPGTPTGVGLTGSGVVSWIASSGATSYEIEFFTARSAAGASAAPTTATGYTVTGISSSPYQLVSPYGGLNNYARVRVRARNSAGASAYSAWVPSATTYT